MSVKYALPCQQCGKPIEVEVRQAGQALDCPACGASNEIPRLGSLKQLDTIGDATEPVSEPVRGNRGWFVFGLLLTVVGALGGGGLFYYGNSLVVDYNVEGAMDRLDTQIDELTDSQVVMMFDFLNVDAGLGDWNEQPHVGQTRQGEILKVFSFAIMGIGVIGLAMMLYAILRQ